MSKYQAFIKTVNRNFTDALATNNPKIAVSFLKHAEYVIKQPELTKEEKNILTDFLSSCLDGLKLMKDNIDYLRKSNEVTSQNLIISRNSMFMASTLTGIILTTNEKDEKPALTSQLMVYVIKAPTFQNEREIQIKEGDLILCNQPAMSVTHDDFKDGKTRQLQVAIINIHAVTVVKPNYDKHFDAFIAKREGK